MTQVCFVSNEGHPKLFDMNDDVSLIASLWYKNLLNVFHISSQSIMMTHTY